MGLFSCGSTSRVNERANVIPFVTLKDKVLPSSIWRYILSSEGVTWQLYNSSLLEWVTSSASEAFVSLVRLFKVSPNPEFRKQTIMVIMWLERWGGLYKHSQIKSCLVRIIICCAKFTRQWLKNCWWFHLQKVVYRWSKGLSCVYVHVEWLCA